MFITWIVKEAEEINAANEGLLMSKYFKILCPV